MSAIDSIFDLANGTFTVTRTAAGSYVAGRYVLGGTSTFDILGCIQTATGKATEFAAVGQRSAEELSIWTTSELRGRDTTNDPDRIDVDGIMHTVMRVEKWLAFGDTHYRAFILREGVL